MERDSVYWDVVRRDGGRCVLCGRPGDDVHEIVPRSKFGRVDWDLCMSERNRVVLCRACHGRVHDVEGRRRLLRLMVERYGYRYDEGIFLRYLGGDGGDTA